MTKPKQKNTVIGGLGKSTIMPDVTVQIPMPSGAAIPVVTFQSSEENGMSKKTTFAKMHPDGTVVEVLPDGTERAFPKTSLHPISDEEIHAAAMATPDAQPLTDERLAHMKQVPRIKTLRRVLNLTQEEFAVRYRIPLMTLRDWEEGRIEPDPPSRAYLRAIAGNPEGVMHALQKGPGG